MEAKPIFTVTNKKGKPRVFLHCSNCSKKIREIKPSESVAVDRGYYCPKCDDGAHHINFPVRDDKGTDQT